MKTAISLLALVIMVTFLIFLNTLTYQKPQENHPPPKSTRVLSSSKSQTHRFSTLQKTAANFVSEKLRASIKTEWSRINQRTHDRDLPVLVSLLRELGRREGLDGIKFIEGLPPLTNKSDFAQAKIAVIAGWGILDHAAAGEFIYQGHVHQLLTPANSLTWGNRFSAVAEALQLAEYEIQKRWIEDDQESFLAMLEEADGGFPVIPARRRAIHDRFPQLPSPYGGPDPDPFSTTKWATNEIKPRFDQHYRSSLPGERSNSLIEWAARNPDLARKSITAPLDESTLIIPSDLTNVIEGLSYQTPDYHSLLSSLTDKRRAETINKLALSILDIDNPRDTWPVDARPSPWKLTRTERAHSCRDILNQDSLLPEPTRQNYLNALHQIIDKQ